MNATPIISIPSDIRDRLAARIARHSSEPDVNGCINWLASLDRHGYGRFSFRREGRQFATTAHRIAWLLSRGDIAQPGLVIDHLCRNRMCLNIAHMELVTNEVNGDRGAVPLKNRAALGLPLHRITPRRDRVNRSECRAGHHQTPENTYVYVASDGYERFECIECRRERSRRYKNRKRTA